MEAIYDNLKDGWFIFWGDAIVEDEFVMMKQPLIASFQHFNMIEVKSVDLVDFN